MLPQKSACTVLVLALNIVMATKQYGDLSSVTVYQRHGAHAFLYRIVCFQELGQCFINATISLLCWNAMAIVDLLYA